VGPSCAIFSLLSLKVWEAFGNRKDSKRTSEEGLKEWSLSSVTFLDSLKPRLSRTT